MGHKLSRQPKTKKLNRIPGLRRERERITRRFPGVLSDVARSIGKTSSHVIKVWNQQAVSEPVAQAILDEINFRFSREQLRPEVLGHMFDRAHPRHSLTS